MTGTIGAEATISIADGHMPAHLAIPAQTTRRGDDAEHVGVVLLHEGFGLNSHTRRVAARLAAMGYPTIAPALFWRSEVLSVGYDDHDEAARLARSADQTLLLSDCEQAAAWLRGEVHVTRVVAIGFCFGGSVAFLAATQSAVPSVSAAVAWYPVRVPQWALERQRAGFATDVAKPLMVLLGADDEFVSDDERLWFRSEIAAALDASMVEPTGAGHAFANDARPELYDAAAASAAWEHVDRFLDRHARTASNFAPKTARGPGPETASDSTPGTAPGTARPTSAPHGQSEVPT